MEDAGRQRRVGPAERQHVGDMPHRACPARSDDRNGQLGQPCERFAGVAVAGAVVVHRREENLARAAPPYFVRPCEEFALGEPLAAVGRDEPYAVDLFGVDGRDDELRTVFRRNGVDQPRIAHSGAVYRDLVGSRVEQPACVRDRRDAAAHGERNVDARRDARYQPGEGAAPLLRGADVEIHQLVGPFGGVFRAEFHRVADVFQLREVDPFDRLPLADVETGNYAFCKHRFSSSSVIRPS